MVDASQKGFGAALLQPNKHPDGTYSNIYRIVAYTSKALSSTQTKLAKIEREMLAVT